MLGAYWLFFNLALIPSQMPLLYFFPEILACEFVKLAFHDWNLQDGNVFKRSEMCCMHKNFLYVDMFPFIPISLLLNNIATWNNHF